MQQTNRPGGGVKPLLRRLAALAAIGIAAVGLAAAAPGTQVRIRDARPHVTPTATPEPTPEPTPAPTPEPTPVPTPTPEPTPVPTEPAVRIRYKKQPRPFIVVDDYVEWADLKGYRSGALTPQGPWGIGMDYFHTQPGDPGYRSGRIVIGDSRCCQLGIYQMRAEARDFATFAVWGGHYTEGLTPPVLTASRYREIEACFQEQIRARGVCKVFVFATINDYDFDGNRNEPHIRAVLRTAETLASLSYTYEEQVYHPRVYLLGLAGGWEKGSIVSIPYRRFNQFCDDYNAKLRLALNAAPLLEDTAPFYATIAQMVQGEIGFIDDGLHYDDPTLSSIIAYLKTL